MELADMNSQAPDAVAGRVVGKRVGVERLAFVMVFILSMLSLISYQFHLFVRNYDSFVIRQVVPASGLQGWLNRTFHYDPSGYDAEQRASLGSPYFPEYDREDESILNATASDYLDIWYYAREMVRGKNPYATSDDIHFVSHGRYREYPWRPGVYEPTVPDQRTGMLSYPPMGPVLILPFYLPNYFASYALYLFVVHLFIFWLAYLLVRRSAGYRLPVALLAATLFVTSYPLGFMIDRGNIEGSVFILVACGLLAYARGRYMTSALLWGVAASGKVVPAIFLALFLLDGRYKELAVSVLTACAATFLAMLRMHEPPGLLVSQMLSHMDVAKNLVKSGSGPSRCEHSLFSMLKGGLFLAFNKMRAAHILRRLFPYYSTPILASTATILYFLRRLPFTNRVLVLTVLMLSFPHVSYDYKLIHLYMPFGMILLGVVRKGWASPAEVTALLILGVIFSPKAYELGHYSLGHWINASLLVALIPIGLWTRFGGLDSGEPRPAASRP